MKRREFIAGLTGAAAWPIAARAQQPERMRRLGVLKPYSVHDVLGLELASALRQGLLDRGRTEARNIEINYRWIGKDGDRRSVYAAELVAASPPPLRPQRTWGPRVSTTPGPFRIRAKRRLAPGISVPDASPVSTADPKIGRRPDVQGFAHDLHRRVHKHSCGDRGQFLFC
jgi:hypothetical protein